MHIFKSVFIFFSQFSGLVAVFKSPSLKVFFLLTKIMCKLPPNLKEARSRQTLRHQWYLPTLLDFNEWLTEKAEGHEMLKLLNSKSKSEEPVEQKSRHGSVRN